MSKQLVNDNGKRTETIKDPEKCAWLYDEVCCNDSSEWLADFPLEFCQKCRYFTSEERKGC